MQYKAPLLFIFAHPDDESFTCGGAMAKYAAAGHSVHLVCATRGEVGEISDPALATPETLGHVREQELRRACRTVGAAEPVFLDYRDSGMMGTPPNTDARAFYQAPPAKVVERLTSIIRRLRPVVVVTFDELGGYGHPDHITIHKHATAAFFAAGRPDSFPHQIDGSVQAWAPSKLYYSSIPQRQWSRLIEAGKALGIEAPAFLADFNRSSLPDETVRTEIDVTEFLDVKQQAILSHKTQINPNNPFTNLPEALMRQFQGVEFYQQVFPGYADGGTETDLLAGA
ncbi:MAG: N-acetyl-1-D-myo-inositol-2-amino-2-deoxy-alpha-D-glucopyranoside deacetylase [Dehalococcoidia bacterium]|nr:N-acetyl-1-D-myo-inositol-2-amino-2-deoxy-alpha-D-glucopyranoside deacetylase [Dehalococcoidia bacterium]